MVTAKTGIRGFVTGFFSLLNAFRFISKNPRLYKYIAIPFIINVVVFCGSVYWGFDLFGDFVGQYLAPYDTWYWQIVAGAIKLLAALVTLVIVFFTFTVVGNLIAAPFNDVLSEKTEEIIVGRQIGEPFSFRQIGVDLWRVMKDEIRKMSIFIFLMILILGLNFLPGIGSALYAVLSVVVTVFFLIVEYTGYIFSRKHLGFAEQRQFIAAHKMSTVGFGLAVMCMLFIPFIQFLTIPVAVVAATQICCTEQC